ncbi:MAG: hypothetical protein NVSMB5_04550 [Candidatus Velthaea sp.]
MHNSPWVDFRTILGAATLALSITGLPANAAACSSVASGQPVLLRSSEMDPDVFVWDSKVRVVDYAAGRWRGTSDVLTHSLLSKPGTRAVVVACDKDAVKSRFVNDVLDAVGVKIVSGPHRGRFGWVTSEDVHSMVRTANSR